MHRRAACLALSALFAVAMPASAQGLKQRLVLEGHTGKILALALSRDGKTLCTAAADHTVRVWDVGKDKLLHVLKPKGFLKALALTPDGKTLVTGGAYDDKEENRRAGVVEVWDVAAGKLTVTITLADKLVEVTAVTVTPDGKTVLASCHLYGTNAFYEGRLVFLDVATGKELSRATTPTEYGTLCMAPDGKTAFAAGWEMAALWDVATGKVVRTLGHGYWGLSLAFSPDGKTVALGSLKQVDTWDADTGKVRHTLYPGWFMSYPRGLTFSPDGKTLAAVGGFGGSHGGLVKFYDAATGKELLEQKQEQVITGVAFTPDGRTLITAGEDKLVRVWDVP